MLALAMAAPAAAQTTDRDIDEVRQKKAAEEERARELEETAAELRRKLQQQSEELKALAARVREGETELDRLNRQRRQTEAEIGAVKERLRRTRHLVAEALSALAGLASAPPLAAVARPGEAEESRLAATALAGAREGLDSMMLDLSAQLAALERGERELARLQAESEATLAALRTDREALQRGLEKRRSMARETEAAAAQARERIQALAEEVRTLSALMQRLENLKPVAAPAAAPVRAGFAALKGRLDLPVRGRIASHFGEKLGRHDPNGIVLRTAQEAIVTAPHDAIVRFAGPFRHYGGLLILDFGDGYHLLVAGVSGIDVVAGQWLLAGEPVGRMSGGAEAGGNELYLELRRGGSPIDPAPWLAQEQRRSYRE